MNRPRHRACRAHPEIFEPEHTVSRSAPASAPRPRSRSRSLSLVALSAVLLLSGCAVPGLPGATGAPDRDPASMDHAATVVETADPSASAKTGDAPADDGGWSAPAGDLTEGTHTQRLTAAAHTLVIDYWTDENPAEWTPDSAPIINLTARIDGAGIREAIRVTRFNARVDSLAAVLANDTGSFALEPPYAYSSAVAVPANPTASSTTVVFTMDLLTETAPGSGVFTRQTVIDSLVIGYAQPGSVALDARQDDPES